MKTSEVIIVSPTVQAYLTSATSIIRDSPLKSHDFERIGEQNLQKPVSFFINHFQLNAYQLYLQSFPPKWISIFRRLIKENVRIYQRKF